MKFEYNKIIELGDVEKLKPKSIFSSNNEYFVGIIFENIFMIIDEKNG
jgi:hypothetical protein